MRGIEELRKRKKELGMTTEVLSSLSGVPVGTLNKILAGSTTSPRLSTMQALEEVLFPPEDAWQSWNEYVRNALIEQGYTEGEVLHDGEPAEWRKTGNSTYEDLELLPGDVRGELIDGEIFVINAASMTHQFIIDYFGDRVKEYIRDNKGKCVPCFSPGAFLAEDDRNFLIPDFAVVCDPEKISNKGIDGGPDFVLEVLSPSTAYRDRTKKFSKYQAMGVREYWLIDPEKKQLTAYTLFGEGKTVLQPLSGKRGLAIFGGKPKIDLLEIRRIIEKYE